MTNDMSSGSGYIVVVFFFFQAEDGIRDLVRSRGLGDVYKRQVFLYVTNQSFEDPVVRVVVDVEGQTVVDQAFDVCGQHNCCLLYTSDAADERSSVDLGGRRIIKKKKHYNHQETLTVKIRN